MAVARVSQLGPRVCYPESGQSKFGQKPAHLGLVGRFM